MTIYVDIVLIENLIMNYIILYATSIILRRKAKKCKLIIGSLVGAIYSITAYIITIPIYSSLTIKFILSIIIVYISFSAQNVRQLARDILIFYLISFAFGGVAFALIYVVKPQDILMKNVDEIPHKETNLKFNIIKRRIETYLECIYEKRIS